MFYKRYSYVLLLFVCTMLCFSTSVKAQSACEYYVDAANTGTVSDGSALYPFRTIGDAVNEASSGDCFIYVGFGHYYESVFIDDPNIILRSKDPSAPEKTVIHGGVNFSGISGCAIDGFTIMDAESPFMMNGQSSGLNTWNSDPLIRRCIIIKNRCHGINIWYGSPRIDHCVIWGNVEYGIFNGLGAPIITNSIIWGNGDGSLHNCHDGVRFCIVQGHTWADSLDGPAIINNDPLFVNADPDAGPPYDFHLQSLAGGIPGVMHDSQAIDMGSADGVISDWHTDIGVYQGYVRTEPIVIPRRIALQQGASKRLNAVGGTAPYTWSSSSPSVAAVDPNNGIVNALKPGYAFVNALSADGTDGHSATVVVRNPGDEYFMGPEYPPGPDPNDLDAAYQYYQDTNDHLGMALTGLVRSLDQPDPNITAILDGLGVTYGGLFAIDDPNKTFGPRTCEDLPIGAPGLDEIQAVLHGSVLPLLDTALGHLEAINGPGYRRYVVDPNDNAIVEIDRTDINLLKAGFHLAHGVIDIVSSYTLWDPNMDYCDDLDDPFKDSNDHEIPDAINDYLAEHPQLLYLLPSSGADGMLDALGHLQAAVYLLGEGLDLFELEDDGQFDDLISLDSLEADRESIDDAREVLDIVEESLDPNTPPAIVYLDQFDDSKCSPLEVNLSAFFLNPLQPDLLPDFDPNNEADLNTFPDPTFHGLLPGMGIARLNGIFADALDGWGYQESYEACENVIGWQIWEEGLGDFVSLRIYRDNQPCVDPNTSTLILFIDPNSIESYLDLWDAFQMRGSYYDFEIDCTQEATYYYLIVAGYSGPDTEMRSGIIPIENTLYWCDGDVNLNGEISPRDALCAFEKYLGICPTSCGIDCIHVCCDVNGVDGCTPGDALCIFQKYLSMPSCLDWSNEQGF